MFCGIVRKLKTDVIVSPSRLSDLAGTERGQIYSLFQDSDSNSLSALPFATLQT